MLLTKYLTKQVSLTFVAIMLVFCFMMVGRTFLEILNKAYEVGISVDVLFNLSLLKFIFDFEILLLLSIFLGVLITLTRLYQDSEITVLNASGISEGQLIKMVAPIIIFVSILVGIFSLELIPWAHQQSEKLLNVSKNKIIIKAGKFQEMDNVLLYVSETSELNGLEQMKDIFSQIEIDGKKVFIVAKTANRRNEKSTGDIYLQLQNGKRYHGFNSQNKQHIISFKNYEVRLFKNNNKQTHSGNLRLKSNKELLTLNTYQSRAEFESRLARPISALLLSIIAVLFAKVSSRQVKGLGILKGILVFITYNNLLVLGKELLENGEVPLFVGLWWVHLLMVGLIYLMFDFRYRLYLSSFIMRLFKTKEKRYVQSTQ
jgi:lipopolysaccharide export system permease protein